MAARLVLLVALASFLSLAGALYCSGTTACQPPSDPVLSVSFTIRDFVNVYNTNGYSSTNPSAILQTTANANPSYSQCQGNSVPGSCSTHATTHPDFNRANAGEQNLVLPTLGSDRKPVFNTARATPSTTISNATWFNWMWNNNPAVNMVTTKQFNMTWDCTQCLYVYNNQNFFPIDDQLYGNYPTLVNNVYHNFGFCLEYHNQFQYAGPEKFKFAGDDDVWFFVNNKLWIDLGGVHGTTNVPGDYNGVNGSNPESFGSSEGTGYITLAKYASYLGLTVGNVYPFDLFYCERHLSASTINFATSIALNNCPTVDACGACKGNVTVNPCPTMNCGQGLCQCSSASCVCNAGYVNGPNGNCSQKCGDGIVQGSEQCDLGVYPPAASGCCSSTCMFLAPGTSCPAQGKPCIQNICSGTNPTCGVPLAINSPCAGGTPPQCQQYQCTSADGSTCGLVNSDAATCTDNNACTTDLCSSGNCLSTPIVCPRTTCTYAGTCSNATGLCGVGPAVPNGVTCGNDTSVCIAQSCQSGVCANVSKPAQTPCGGVVNNGCASLACNGAGGCVAQPIGGAQGTAQTCPVSPAGSCNTSVCSGTSCAVINLSDGTACSTGASPRYCEQYSCVGGRCLVQQNPATAGKACTYATGSAPPCQTAVCQAALCVYLPDLTQNLAVCAPTGGNPQPNCTQYTCSSGSCNPAPINEQQICATAPDACHHRICASGVCTTTNANDGGSCGAATNCSVFICSSGSCNTINLANGTSCWGAGTCSPALCDGGGSCVAHPIVCSVPPGCSGSSTCVSGSCTPPAPGSCCGNGRVDPSAGEQCDNAADPCCGKPGAGASACQWLPTNTSCQGSNTCTHDTCQPISVGASQTTCAPVAVANFTACSTFTVTNPCVSQYCVAGVCKLANTTVNTPCSTSSPLPYCAVSLCDGVGTCQLQPNSTVQGQACPYSGTVPQCNTPVCQGINCGLTPVNANGACTSLLARACSTLQCNTVGQCLYNNFAVNTSCSSALNTTNPCLAPVCDGNGGCSLVAVAAKATCTFPSDGQCNFPGCDGTTGTCILYPQREGLTCSAPRDLQCQVSTCVGGTCTIANVTDTTPCTRGDTPQCQVAQCLGGQCVNVNARPLVSSPAINCTPSVPDSNPCVLYQCDTTATCSAVNLQDGTPCPDGNLCNTETCSSGVCVKTVAVICPSTSCTTAGTCNPSTGVCSAPIPFQDGTTCGADTTVCIAQSCVSGVCSNVSKPAQTPCGGVVNSGCSSLGCDGAGACVPQAIASAQGAQQSCAEPPAGSCNVSVCSGTGCATINLADGTACSTGATPKSCEQFVCHSGSCVVQQDPASVGQSCAYATGSQPPCQTAVCQAAQCVYLPDLTQNLAVCAPTGGNLQPNCTQYTCSSGSCNPAPINEQQKCGSDPDACHSQVCHAGTCNVVAANDGSTCSTANSCAVFTCSAGSCQTNNFANGTGCGGSGTCTPSFCDGNGTCVATPVVCTLPSSCTGTSVCTAGSCVVSAGACCGNGVVDNGEECDSSSDLCCGSPSAGVNACHWLPTGTSCQGSNQCTADTCQPITTGSNHTVCTSVNVPDTSICSALTVTTFCQTQYCLSGVCSLVNKAVNTTCPFAGSVPFCALSVCNGGGSCVLQQNDTAQGQACPYSNVPDCNTPVCQGISCGLTPANANGACTSLASRACSATQCDTSGQCVYSDFAVNTSCSSALNTTNPCLAPVCDGTGGCGFVAVAAKSTCTFPSDGQCNFPGCDGSTGTCILFPQHEGQSCSAPRDLQCQVSTCVGGTCTIANVTDTTPCTRGDTPQCQVAQCLGGQCVNVNARPLVSSPAINCTPSVPDSNPCVLYQCDTTANCSAVNLQDGTACPDGNLCDTETCSSGVCIKILSVICNGSVCTSPGTCTPATGVCTAPVPFQDGTTCGADTNSCTAQSCVSGLCSNVSKPAQTPCGGVVNSGCSSLGCDGAGACVPQAIASTQGTQQSCAEPPAGSCNVSVCSGTGCATINLADGTACSTGATPKSCEQFVCHSGSCVVQQDPASVGQSCAYATGSAPPCYSPVCQAAACVYLPSSSLDTTVCAPTGGNPQPNCTQYTCSSGSCLASPINEAQTCGTAPDTCHAQVCQNGNCTTVAANDGATCSAGTSCAVFACSSGACATVNFANGTACGGAGTCTPTFCDGAGTCVPQPIVCTLPASCTGSVSCVAGACVRSPGACCGNGVVDLGEDCDDATDKCCGAAGTPSGCQWLPANTSCQGGNTCTVDTCQSVSNTTNQTACTPTPVTDQTTCSALTVTSPCQTQYCIAGACSLANLTILTPCTSGAPVPFCAVSVCDGGGSCVLQQNDTAQGLACSYSATVPDCNTPVCQGISCGLTPANANGGCASLASRACSATQCDAVGECVYADYPVNTSCSSALNNSNPCLTPACDGSGGCGLIPVAAQSACTFPSDGQCNFPGCDGTTGTCILFPQREGLDCSAPRDLQCQVSTCVGGTCTIANVTDTTPCTRGDTPQCQVAQCFGGACVNVNARPLASSPAINCTPSVPDPNPCVLYQCDTTATCSFIPVPDGTACPDGNLCDSEVCTSGTCVKTLVVLCTSPTLPCEALTGTCVPSTGNCTYGGLPQYSPCIPSPAELVDGCNSSISGNYRCAVSSPTSACLASCGGGAICGDGIVSIGEQCDWAIPPYGDACCDSSCTFKPDYTPCNASSPEDRSQLAAQAQNDSQTLDLPITCWPTLCYRSPGAPSRCSLYFTANVTVCQVPTSSTNTKSVVLASVLTGGLIAIIAAAVAVFLWRRASKVAEAEWLQEYLSSGNHRVENNAAFVEPGVAVNNPSFDG